MSISRSLRATATLAGVVVCVVAMSATVHARKASATDLELYRRTLEQYTHEVKETVGTRVDYRGLRASPDWPILVASLRRSDLSEVRSPAQKKAFWINAYNILAIDRVVQGNPEETIRDLGSLFRSVWKLPAGTIGGTSVTLHHTEHEILRPMGDPRIHGALVCASTSCPSLLREPWIAEQLEDQFDRSLRRWLTDSSKGVSIDRASKSVRLSSIFDWFEVDFDAGGGVVPFIAKYLGDSDARWLLAHADVVDIAYLDYDWSLNRLERD